MTDQPDTTDQNGNSNIVVRQSYNAQLSEFENGLISFLAELDLPTQSIFVPVNERVRVFNNLGYIMEGLSSNKKQESVYLSKFIAASASGLFDAALNYLWDETIAELRKRVAQYDLSYFYDNAVRNQEKRRGLNTAEDLVKIEDSELIYGAKEIGLISDLGFRHLDYVRYMRNWASAAHPNQNEITGLQLASLLETCIREVISLPLSQVVVNIRILLSNIKTNIISETEARAIGAFFLSLTQNQVNNLASGFFGIYTRLDTTPPTRQNVHRLLPLLWNRVDEATRQQFGVKYGKFVADNAQEEANLARQFLDLVSATSYFPDALRVVEMQTAIDNLLNAHRNFSNFYNEPPFAQALQQLVGSIGRIPAQITKEYILAVVEVFLTNGNGVAWNAEPVYRSLFDLFDSEQASIAVLSFSDDTIASKLQFKLCEDKYRELMEIMKIKISAPALRELIDDIEEFGGSFELLRKDSKIKQKVNNIAKILNINLSL